MTGMDVFSVSGLRVLVTGGSMGIGMGIVKRFVEGGSKVLIADRVTEPATKYIKSLASTLRQNISVTEVDLLNDSAPEAMMKSMMEHYGGIDVLVNNAGIYPMSPMLEMSEELFDRVYRINLRAMAFTCKAAARLMIEQKTKGKIVNIASIDSVHPSYAGLAAYDASKGGVLMFTKNFALEVAKHGILVNAIAPGGINTEGTTPASMASMSAEERDKMMRAFVSQIPVGRMGTPDDIAKVAVFLASHASDYMTGSLVIVDGGRLLM